MAEPQLSQYFSESAGQALQLNPANSDLQAIDAPDL
jgi:hypothetical protein